MLSQTALGWFLGTILVFSCLGNVYGYFAIATEEERPGARRAYYVVNITWSLFNLGIVALLIYKCFA